LQHAAIPRQINFERPNGHIQWDRMALRVNVDADRAWPQTVLLQ
jgi:acyl transferase domain-containing protein